MNNILTVLRFGCGYLPRYWVRLALSVVFGGVFALTNGSFMWATRTLTERFAPAAAAPAQPGPSDARDRFSVAIERLGQSVQRAIDPWLPRAGQPLEWRQAVGLLLLLPILVFLRSGADYGNNYCLGWVSERVVRDMRLDVMEKLSQLSLEFFTRSRTGDLLTRINVDTYNLLRALRQGVADLIKESFTIMVVFCGLLWLDWRLTCAAMVLLPACLLPLMVLGRKAHRAMAVSRKANVLQSSQLVELLGSIRVVKAYNLEAVEMARFRRTSGQLVRAGMKGVKAKELVNPLIEIISVLGLGALLLYVFQAGRSGPELVAFITGILLFFLPLKKLAGVHIVFEQASVGVHRLSELLAEQPKVVEAPNPKPVSGFESELRFERVSFAYDDRVVLKDVNLVIPRGARLGVAGDSGSGKTTLLNLIPRFYDATEGEVLVDGENVREIVPELLWSRIGMVPQKPYLFSGTVGSNLRFGDADATDDQLWEALEVAQAKDFVSEMDGGLDARIAQGGSNVSGGQRQRLAIARALVRKPGIYLFDDSFSALDLATDAHLRAALVPWTRDATVIVVGQRVSSIRSADQILVLEDGHQVGLGTHEQLIETCPTYLEIVESQRVEEPA